MVNGYGTVREIENMDKHGLIQEVYSLRRTVSNLNKQIKELRLEISEQQALQPSQRKLLIPNSGVKSYSRTPPKILPKLDTDNNSKAISLFDKQNEAKGIFSQIDLEANGIANRAK